MRVNHSVSQNELVILFNNALYTYKHIVFKCECKLNILRLNNWWTETCNNRGHVVLTITKRNIVG